ncbi:DUF5666 domain-containing protein [Streptomyces lincolnensis]|uniref:DUF5666 domain-containing protein n=1 Tax=Streptomyces lincolnensis TaxID=1915 RepID=UPI000831B976|nr:DUF5666 domain-containing protein [Streptomyces lincolnensis]QMV04916.1 hypothetical protein GJU35_04120 [Streptomyces lincolnensis]
MTHDPDQPHTTGNEPPEPPTGTTPHQEVVTGPGGAEPRTTGVRRRASARTRTVVAATAVAVLAVGGTVAYAATSADSGPSATGATPSGSASASLSPDERPGDGHGRGPWFGRGGNAVHGESTVKDPDSDEWVVRIWQRGTVEKVDGDQVTVKSEDGAVWTWTVDADTQVLPEGTSGSDALTKGDTAFLAGTRSDDGDRTATRVLTGTWPGTRHKEGDGGWLDRLPGHGPRDERGSSPSGSGATT